MTTENETSDIEVLKLTREEVLELRVTELEAQAARSEANYQDLARRVYLAQIDPEGRLAKYEKSIQAQLAIQGKAAIRQKQVKERIEARLGFSIDSYSFDDETGALHAHDVEATKVES